MSMNKFMHPRNIYKQPPNFKQLALEYPEFRKFAIQDISGKVTINFKNSHALRALTWALLKKDFDLDIHIPENKLIPTVPLRLNYILWIEDLLNLSGRSENVKGIDIGTGASCIYPVLAAKKNNWAMVGTEVDSGSIECALENVKRNSLEDLIEIIRAKGDTLLEEVLEVNPTSYDFCMCNPPFFSTTEELHKARKQNRPHPKNAFCASVGEVVVRGGEVEYITKLIKESAKSKTRITIYTTMVGQKCDLPVLKRSLREIDVVSFKQTEFCQGNTTRWGLAWTFNDIDLTKIPDSLVAAKQKLPKPLFYKIPKMDGVTYTIKHISEKVIEIFHKLEIDCQKIKHSNHLIEYIIIAFSNTWSHQRRKKREKLKGDSSPVKSNNNNNNNSDNLESTSTCNKLAEMNLSGSSSNKRAYDEDDGYYNIKKLKTDLEECIATNVFLKAKISIIKVDSDLALELIFYEGMGGKESLNQVLQYLKNNLLETN